MYIIHPRLVAFPIWQKDGQIKPKKKQRVQDNKDKYTSTTTEALSEFWGPRVFYFILASPLGMVQAFWQAPDLLNQI